MKLMRRLALLSCALIDKALPPDLRVWGNAIRNEILDIDNDAQALRFALGNLFGLARRGVTFQLLRFSDTLSGHELSTPGGLSTMSYLDDWQATPRSVGVICAIGATLLGFVFMMMGGAPIGYLGVNLGALVVGLLLMANFVNRRFLPSQLSSSRWHGTFIMAAGLALLATALFGLKADGVARWAKFGPLVLQPSLILLPMMVVSFARSQSILATFGIFAAIIALALQPDRAMAATLAAGMVTLAVNRMEKVTAATALASIAGFLVAMARPDASPAVPFVDQIITGSFDIHAVAGLAVVGGLTLLVLPAFAGLRLDKEMRLPSMLFGVTWATIILAAALGNSPTPVVGYSGSAILGYMLSLAMLPKAKASPALGGQDEEAQSHLDLPADRSVMLRPA